MNLFEDSYEAQMLRLQLQADSDLVFNLTNGRDLGGGRDRKEEVILSGYNKIMSFVNKVVK